MGVLENMHREKLDIAAADARRIEAEAALCRGKAAQAEAEAALVCARRDAGMLDHELAMLAERNRAHAEMARINAGALVLVAAAITGVASCVLFL